MNRQQWADSDKRLANGVAHARHSKERDISGTRYRARRDMPRQLASRDCMSCRLCNCARPGQARLREERRRGAAPAGEDGSRKLAACRSQQKSGRKRKQKTLFLSFCRSSLLPALSSICITSADSPIVHRFAFWRDARIGNWPSIVRAVSRSVF